MVDSGVTDPLEPATLEEPASRAVRPEPRVAADDVAWIRALPKAELHLHLSGSLRPTTAIRLARERRRFEELDDQTLAERLRAPDACADQAELLEAFALPMALLQDAEALGVAAAELVADVAGDGTRYAEIRFGPANHTQAGLSIEDAIAAVLSGIEAGRAAVDPAPHVRLIVVAMRTDAPEVSLAVARAALAARADGVCGFDFAGLEATAPSVEPHLPAFELARDGGLGISVHAGEWGGAPQVRHALRADPDRIAHGGPAADDPGLVAELRARGVTLDLCPTSNTQAGLVRALADHPLPRLYHAGVTVTVSTDDRTVSATDLCRELALAMDPLGLSRDDLVELMRNAMAAAFLQDEEGVRDDLLMELAAAVAPASSAGGGLRR